MTTIVLIGRCRIVSGAIFLFVAYLHASATGLSAPGEEPLATAAESSSTSDVTVYPCAAQSGKRGCPVEAGRPRRSVGRTQVREKRSSSAALDDPDHGYPEGGFLVHQNGNKPTWNVPFRMMFGNERRGFKLGKRFPSSNDLDNDLDNDLEKRFGGSRDRGPIKFGRRRRKNTDSGIGPDTEHKKSVVYVGKKLPDSQRKTNGNPEIGSKRKFKFGKRYDPEKEEEEEEEDGGEIQDEDKRRILFGKRGTRFQDVDESVEDSPDPVEAKRRRKFNFG